MALRHLESFTGRTRGAGAAAREAGVSVERMLYRVRQFLGAGLLRGLGQSAAPGSPCGATACPAVSGALRPDPFTDLEAQIARHGRLSELGLNARLLYRAADSGKVHSEVLIPQSQTLAELRQHAIGGDYMGVLWLDDGAARRVQAHLDAIRGELGEAGPGQKAGRAPPDPA